MSSVMPTRGTTADPSYDGPDEDPSEVTKLFTGRISAWSNAVDYLEDYVKTTEKIEHSHAKEYEKVLKTVNSPLKEGHQFDQSVGGISGMFENIRTNTQGLHQSHNETAKAIKQTVLPIFERLSGDLKSRGKEVSKSAGKGSKIVDKARAASAKHIERLGQHTAAFDSSAGKVSANDDPYVLHRGIYHRLHHQVQEENNNREDLINIQNDFAKFEAHIVESVQQGMLQFDKIMAGQADRIRVLYGEMNTHASRIRPDFEWNGFINRNRQVLIDPREPKRDVSTMGFANQDHPSTKAIIAGSLERKSKVLKKYEAGFYAVTPSKFLHEFKTDDNLAKDPVPENSLYLPDCMIGALDGAKFALKGKDASKGSLGSKLSMSHEYQFQAHTPQEAQKWYDAIRAVAGQTTTEMPDSDGSSHASQAGMAGGLAGAGAAGGLAHHNAAGQHTTGHNTAVPGQTGQTGQTAGTAGQPMSGGLGQPTGAAGTGQPMSSGMAPGQTTGTAGYPANGGMGQNSGTTGQPITGGLGQSTGTTGQPMSGGMGQTSGIAGGQPMTGGTAPSHVEGGLGAHPSAGGQAPLGGNASGSRI